MPARSAPPAAVQMRRLPGPGGEIAAYLQGDPAAPAVVMTHSILSSSLMWQAQATLLAGLGFHVVRLDTRGHGASGIGTADEAARCSMQALGADTLAAMDALGIARAHYIGLSLGGMSGFGLGIHHGQRLLSLLLCDARADAPPAVAAPWDERIAIAQRDGSCAALAAPTIERWFGKPFVEAHPEVAARFQATAAATQVNGFVAAARAIQGLDYIGDVVRIQTPTTFIVGSQDGVLPQAMQELQSRMPHAVLETIDGAGHLPNIDQPAAFDAALLRHFDRVAPTA